LAEENVTCQAEAVSDIVPASRYYCISVQQCMLGWCRQA